MMWEQKYGDFFQKPPNFVPQIKKKIKPNIWEN